MTKEKILLFGGTAESKEIVHAVLQKGYTLTLSTASNDNLGISGDSDLTHKVGKMSEEEITSYLNDNNFCAVICAVHPYAQLARDNIISACTRTNTRILTYLREDTELESLPSTLEMYYVSSHIEAAELANSFTGNILLTTGSRNLVPYMNFVVNSNARIFARVLNCQESEVALESAGISPEHSLLARGPFSIAQNIEIIKRFNIKILITKDGGKKGGTPEKLSAAAETNSKVILIIRPLVAASHYSNLNSLLAEL